MPNPWLTIAGGLVSAAGALVVLIPALRVKSKDIENQTERWRIDPLFMSEYWRKEFYRQRKYGYTCLFLVLVGLVFQILGAL